MLRHISPRRTRPQDGASALHVCAAAPAADAILGWRKVATAKALLAASGGRGQRVDHRRLRDVRRRLPAHLLFLAPIEERLAWSCSAGGRMEKDACVCLHVCLRPLPFWLKHSTLVRALARSPGVPPMEPSPVGLLRDAHLRALMICCDVGQVHYDRFQQVVRMLGARLSSHTGKRLFHLDTVSAFLPHVTPQMVESILAKLRSELAKGCPSRRVSPRSVTPIVSSLAAFGSASEHDGMDDSDAVGGKRESVHTLRCMMRRRMRAALVCKPGLSTRRSRWLAATLRGGAEPGEHCKRRASDAAETIGDGLHAQVGQVHAHEDDHDKNMFV